MRVTREFHMVSAIGCAALAGLFGDVFHERYWRWRDCFNELGRCYDPVSEQVFVEGAGYIWGTPVVAFGCVALVFWWRARRSS
jgi:hypothetical protein